MRRIPIFAWSVLSCVALAGCASPPLPVAKYTRAQTLVQQAERNQAQQFAAVDLERARKKLQQAHEAMDAREAELAERYASEAALDAELALARSSAAQAEKSAAELSASIKDLRAESQRNMNRP
jgi:biopolymer transport protein ExbB/TolQ